MKIQSKLKRQHPKPQQVICMILVENTGARYGNMLRVSVEAITIHQNASFQPTASPTCCKSGKTSTTAKAGCMCAMKEGMAGQSTADGIFSGL